MYGWRGRIGLILPADNTMTEPEFARMMPDGVSAHAARLFAGPIAGYPDQALDYARRSFPTTRVTLIAHMCAASTLRLGPEGERRFATALSEAAGGIPAFTVTSAMIEGMRALNVGKVAILSPHAPDGVALLRAFLAECGIHGTADQALSLMDLDARDQFNAAAAARLYRIARGMDLRGHDALFIPATNLGSLDVIAPLEADLGVPVLTSNQLAMWGALKRLSVSRAGLGGFGRLMAAA